MEKMLNQQISRGREVLMEVTYELSKEGSREINKLESERESAFNQKIFEVRM